MLTIQVSTLCSIDNKFETFAAQVPKITKKALNDALYLHYNVNKGHGTKYTTVKLGLEDDNDAPEYRDTYYVVIHAEDMVVCKLAGFVKIVK